MSPCQDQGQAWLAGEVPGDLEELEKLGDSPLQLIKALQLGQQL